MPERPVIDVRPAAPAEAEAIARIHSEALPADFLPSLGRDFLARVHYPATFASPYGVNLVAVSAESTPIGFVTVAHDAARFSGDVMRRGLLSIAWYVLRATLRDPRHLRLSAEVLWSVLTGRPDPVNGEIFLIAVDRAWQGKGAGQALVRASLAYLSEHGVDRCRTKTLASNDHVIRMYERLGWAVRDRFSLIGRSYVTIVSPVLVRPT
ncbi:MAG TPA: GNAT family N-acetyltransferase [Vicinamibacterales bacterium]|nr:GNAT family N-acetyltransferase [Vicinamibacterales bacterium]